VALVVTLVVLWYLGGTKSVYDARVTVNAPPEKIFALLVDADSRKKWESNLIESKLITDSPVQAGSRFTSTFESDKNLIDSTDEILLFEPNEVVSIRHTQPAMVSTSIFKLSQTGEQTSLVYTVKELRIGWHRITGPMKKSSTQSRIDKEILLIKQLAESNSTKHE
jgi:hypothetical protein